MWKNRNNIIFFIINLWHTYVWMPFTAYLLKKSWRRPIVWLIHSFFGSLVILRIIAPEQGEIPCLIHMIFRSKNSVYKGIKFKKRVKLLLKFWRS